MEAKGLKLFGRRFSAGRIVATVEVSGDRQTGLGSGGANEAEDLLVAVERFAGPVFGDLGEEAMLDGVPFGSARRIVGHGEGQAEESASGDWSSVFQARRPTAIAAAGVAQNEELAGTWIARAPFLLPPMRNGVSGKGGCVVRDADRDRPSIGEQIVDAVRNGDAGGVRAEVVIVDQAGRAIPSRPGVLEVADQFALFGVDADDGQPPTLEAIAKIAEVEELIVAIGTGVGGELLVIDAQGIAHLLEQPGDGVGTDEDTEVAERHGDLGGRAAGPLQAGDGIAGGVVFEQELDQGDDVGGFFSASGRPPPTRRIRPDATS